MVEPVPTDAPTTKEDRKALQDRMVAVMKLTLEDKKVTEKALAGALGVNPVTVGRWFEGITLMPAWALARFCDLYEVDPRSLMGPEHGVKVEAERRGALNDAANVLREISAAFESGRIPKELS